MQWSFACFVYYIGNLCDGIYELNGSCSATTNRKHIDIIDTVECRPAVPA